VRPKSPPLQPASARLVASSIRLDAKAEGHRAVRIKRGVSGIVSIQFSATAAAAARGGAFFRPAVTIGFLEFTLDPDNGKDQDCSRTFRCGAIHG
jgi:hypothetical protein